MESDSKSGEDDYLYFPVKNVLLKDLPDFSKPRASGSVARVCRGRVVDVNGKKIALLKYQDQVFALDEKCPHMGGPLHLGDIETIGEALLPCIVCPWHNWKFSLENGRLKHPENGVVTINLYPVRVQKNGAISVGFKSFDPNSFRATDF